MSLLKKVWIFRVWFEILSCETFLSRNSTCLTAKRQFSIVSFNPPQGMHWNTARMFRTTSVAVLAANEISSTYWATWLALTTGPKYSRMKLEKLDTDLLRPRASFFRQKFCLQFWMQAFLLTVDPLSANSDKPGCKQACRIGIFCQILCCVWQSAYWMILISVIICNYTAEFPQIHEKT